MSHAQPIRSPSTPEAADTTPWWRVKMLWLVLGGPIVVVIASFITLGLAITHPDPVLSTAPVPSADDAADGKAVMESQLPAQQARNHAATVGR
jgi:hypothetical protein